MQKPLPFPELEEERDRADRVKQNTPVLVILGNPPYNGYAGMAVDEEAEMLAAYRTTKLVRKPEGQGLNDLYVRFFRMAERRITEKTGQGVVCFISNYSWLDGLSFTGMRERYLREFDADTDRQPKWRQVQDWQGRRRTAAPDPSIFSTPSDPVGIQVGYGNRDAGAQGPTTSQPKDGGVPRTCGDRPSVSELTETAEAAAADAMYDEV